MKSSASFQLLLLVLCGWIQASVVVAWAADSNEVARFDVQGYLVSDTTAGAPSVMPMISGHTGTNLGVDEIVRAATDLQGEYARNGHTNVSIAVGAGEMTNGVVTLHVFQSAVPQIRIAGKRYTISSNEVEVTNNLLPPPVTNAPVSPVGIISSKPVRPSKPPTPEQEAVRQKISELNELETIAEYPSLPAPTTQMIFAKPVNETNDVQAALQESIHAFEMEDRRVGLVGTPTNSVASTNNGPVFEVKGYELIGNSLLPTNLTELVLQPYIGTNITFARLRSALTDLQTVYREHGFATVSVTLPQQTLSDKIVKIRVFEGRLERIEVVNNHYFSSNNVMRALPSLHDNMVLMAPVFQTELDRANANQDRQIYPALEPGPVEGTTVLKLDVKDRFPMHGKVEFNNENSPNTPALRINSSAEYKNFFQMENSLGLQYSFSPEKYKAGDWNWYDRPLVANYSAFYRMPLGNPEAVANTLNGSTQFGYSEATRRFNLPPPSGQPELNFFASRSTIDTGLEKSPVDVIFNVPGVREVTRQDLQQDITVDNAMGFQFTDPLPEVDGIRSTWSASLNYKSYELTSAKTNSFSFTEITVDAHGNPNPPIVSTVSSPVPLTTRLLDYLPLGLRYDASSQDDHGVTSFGLGVQVNAWYSGTRSNLDAITDSKRSTGHWVILNPAITRDFNLPKNWILSLHGEAQWTSEPLPSNEQFGSGGVNSVRGYHEGEVFGDKGWRIDLDLKTPPHVVGIAYGKQPMIWRGVVFMDYSEVYLMDPQGRQGTTPLWSAGIGWVATIGPHWETRLLFAVPFDSAGTVQSLQPRFNFSLIGQF